jgi:hypothetical protein
LKGRSNTGNGSLIKGGSRSQMLVDEMTHYYCHLKPKKADDSSLNCGKSQTAAEMEMTCGGMYSGNIWLK